jgi:hypothetical protein
MKIFHDLLTYSYGDFQKADFIYKTDLATGGISGKLNMAVDRGN